MSFSIKVQARKAHQAAALAVGAYLTQTAQQPPHDDERTIVANAIGQLVTNLPDPKDDQSVVVEAYGSTSCGLGDSGQYDRFQSTDVTIKVRIEDDPKPATP